MRQVSFEAVGGVTATFLCAEDVRAGDPVGMAENDTVEGCYAGLPPCGVALSVSGDGFAAVLLAGAAQLKYSGTTPQVGWQNLCGDGDGGLRCAESGDQGRAYRVLSVDTAGKTAVVLL